jgi:phosphoglycerate dehydrogenase-like enzyme
MRFPSLEISVPADEDERESLAAKADVIVVQQDRVDRDLLEAADGVRLVAKMGRVYDNIDVEAARERGITMVFVPRKGPNCVAELDIALILALSKDLIWAHRNVAEGAYHRRGLRPSITTQEEFSFHWMKMVRVHEVRGKILGIVGMGEIGTELSRRASALDMSVLYYDVSRLSAELEQRYAVEYKELNHLLRTSDYVVLAVPQTPATEHMIGAEELALIGPQGYLVNACRGRVVDEAALIEALREGTIAGAGLDVYTYEPLPDESPLCTLDNVIMTPHIGGGTGTTEALELMETLSEVESILAGNAPENLI